MDSNNFQALKVDGKILYVFASNKIPYSIHKLSYLKGIEFVNSNYEARKPFEELEAKIEEQKWKDKSKC